MSEKPGILTQRELEIAKLKTKGLMNLEIAKQLNVSPEYVSQTLAGIMLKIKKVEDSIKLLEELSLIEEGTRFRLSTKGKQLVGVRRLQRRLITLVTFAKKPKIDNIISDKDSCNYCPLKTPIDLAIPGGSDLLLVYGLSSIPHPFARPSDIKLIQRQGLCPTDKSRGPWETDKCIAINPIRGSDN